MYIDPAAGSWGVGVLACQAKPLVREPIPRPDLAELGITACSVTSR